MRRLLALFACVFMLGAFACNGNNDDDDPSPTPIEPDTTEEPLSAGNFQLVGDVEQAFLGINPDVDLPSDATSAPSTTSDPATTPGATGSTQSAPQPGVLRISLDDVTDELANTCGLTTGQDAIIYWTTLTQFSTALSIDNLESALEGRTLGILGNIIIRPDGDDDDDDSGGLETVSPTTPDATDDGTEEVSASPISTPSGPVRDCALIATTIGTEASITATASPRRTAVRPAATRTPTPAPTRTATPRPTATRSPSPAPATESPDPTDSPEPTDDE